MKFDFIRLPRYISMAALMLLASACGNNNNLAEEEDAAATSSGGSGSSFSTSLTMNNLNEVEDNMVPGSLQLNLESGTALAGDDGLCPDTMTFSECQSTLVRAYLDIAKSVLGFSNEFIEAISPGLSTLELGSEGSIDIDDGSNLKKIDYRLTAEDDFELIFHGEDGPFLHLEVDGSIITLSGDNDKNGDDSDQGQVQIAVDYT